MLFGSLLVLPIPTVRAGGSGLSLGGDTGLWTLVKHLSIPPWPPDHLISSRADVPLHTQHPCFNLFGCLIFLIIDKLNEFIVIYPKDPEESEVDHCSQHTVHPSQPRP